MGSTYLYCLCPSELSLHQITSENLWYPLRTYHLPICKDPKIHEVQLEPKYFQSKFKYMQDRFSFVGVLFVNLIEAIWAQYELFFCTRKPSKT